jgi:omega-hydroxy-beta-dihydromenaquinone-9 sulfotransferase
VSPLLFVLGTGRCGSTLVHEVLARHGGVGFISNLEDRAPLPPPSGRWNQVVHRRLPPEYARKGRLRFGPSEGYRLLEREVSPMLVTPYRDLTAEDAQPWLAHRLSEFFDERMRAQGKPVFLHKFTGWPRIGFLHEIFPEARFVHVVRDGRAVANSWLQMPWWTGYRGPDQWWLGPLGEEDAEEYERSGRSFVVLAAIAWKMLIRTFESSSRQLPPGAYLELRYEDVVADATAGFGRILDFAGLEADHDFARSLSRYRFDSSRTQAFKRDLTLPAQEALQGSLGELLDRYGYT